MRNNLSKILLGTELFAAILVLGAVLFWAPVCDGLLTLENGTKVHMKCFYTAQVSLVLAIFLFVTACIAYLSKVDHRKVHWLIILVGIMLLANTFDSAIGIGICKKSMMACHTTAIWLRLSGVISILTGILDIVFNNKSNQWMLN